MWKNYNRFYNQILRSEICLFTRSLNIHKSFILKEVCLVCATKDSPSIKKTLSRLYCLQMLTNKRAKVVTLKKSSHNSKIRKGVSLGSSFRIRKDLSLQFLFFCFFNQTSQLKLVEYVSANEVFLTLRLISFSDKLAKNFGFSKDMDSIQLLFSFDGRYIENNFLLRFSKLPVKEFLE